MLNQILKPTVTVAIMALALSACGKKSEDKKEEDTATTTSVGNGTNSDGTVTLSGSLSLGASLTGDTLSDLIFYCITFESVPGATSSMFDDAGAFSIKVKANTPFGCFVNNKTSGKTIATVVVDSGSTGTMGGSASSMALSGGVSLGALSVGTDGTIKVPAERLAAVKQAASSNLDLNAVHNSTYKMECSGSGDRYDACMRMMSDDGGSASSMTVMFRILKGKEGTKDILGMGVWESKPGFDACGGFDMNAAQVAKIASEGITFTQNSVGEFAGADCTKRDSSADLSSKNIQKYFALSQLIPIAGGYSFFEENKDEHGSCKNYHSTAIDFTGSATELNGAFASKNVNSGDCGSETGKNEQGVFNVKFTKQP